MMDRGWVECGVCEGGGTKVSLATLPAVGRVTGPCPDCLDGLIPPEGMVEASALALVNRSQWDEYDIPQDVELTRSAANAALIAAARWEREQ